MKNIVNKILGRHKKSEKPIKEEEILKLVNPDVKFGVEVDGEHGEFIIDIECNNLSDKCAENVALLLYHTSTGGLTQFLTDGLSKWQYLDKENYEERNDFCTLVADKLLNYESLLIGNTDEKEDLGSDKVAVRASQVFNLKELN